MASTTKPANHRKSRKPAPAAPRHRVPGALALYTIVLLILFTCEDLTHSNPNDPAFTITPPGNLTAIPLSDSQIHLSWTDNTGYETGFRIERDADSGFTEIGTVGADVTEFTDTGLTFGQSYGYRVAAYTALNQSDYSAIAAATAIAPLEDIDGNVYSRIKIGDQVWMAENLRVTHYRDGDPIPNVTDNSEWISLTTGAYSAYANNSVNVSTYGRLYNWYVLNDSRNIAPAGWHVPTDDEWKALEMALGMSQSDADADGWRGTNEGSKLAGDADLWQDGGLESNAAFGSSGFAALPASSRDANSGYYYGMGGYANFWLPPETGSSTPFYRMLYCDYSEFYRGLNIHLRLGFSVRCVRD